MGAGDGKGILSHMPKLIAVDLLEPPCAKQLPGLQREACRDYVQMSAPCTSGIGGHWICSADLLNSGLTVFRSPPGLMFFDSSVLASILYATSSPFIVFF